VKEYAIELILSAIFILPGVVSLFCTIVRDVREIRAIDIR
jgi:hypothetical protein